MREDRPRRWKSSWLYRPIFAQVERLWKQMYHDAAPPWMGTPPERIRIEERAAASWDAPGPSGSIRRVWTYDANGLRLESRQQAETPYAPGVWSGAYYQVGLVQFHISEDRKRIYLGYLMGPRYGREMFLLAVGQGKRAQWHPDPEAVTRCY